jgi:hypothetical protein
MIDARRRTFRTSTRQAIVAIYDPRSSWAALSRPLLLDVAAVLTALNGFSVAVGCTNTNVAREIGPALPAGVDLRLRSTGTLDAPAIDFARQFVNHGFERIIVVAADTIGLSTRLLSTAASVLANEPLVVGPSVAGGLYLAGAGAKAIEAGDPSILAAFGAIAGDESTAIGGVRLERQPRLGTVVDESELREIVKQYAPLVPRTAARMAEGFE